MVAPDRDDAVTLKDSARQAVDARRDALIDLSHRIHATPELAFEEERSAAWVADVLADAGFAITMPAYDLSTAFVARAGQGPLHLAICAEYDALPGIGHACGHNIIAAAAAGAGVGLARLADEVGLTVSVIGTPGEEPGDAGGKILLLERGAFSGVHAAMMVHPSAFDVLMPVMSAAGMFDVHYTGKEAHAAAAPQFGINAADALVVAQVGIGLLRQHIDPTDRVHGIVTKGGDAPNIVPADTAARYMLRADTLQGLTGLRDRVLRCFEAGAVATGCQLRVEGGDSPYAQMEHDPALAAIFAANADALGRSSIELSLPLGSTDMGNVSRVVPSIHPYLGIESWPAINHQPEFAACCAQPPADRAVIDGAIALAWTSLDVAADNTQRRRLLGDRLPVDVTR